MNYIKVEPNTKENVSYMDAEKGVIGANTGVWKYDNIKGD